MMDEHPGVPGVAPAVPKPFHYLYCIIAQESLNKINDCWE